jgi:transposase
MKRIKESHKKQGVMFATHYVDDRLAENDKVYLFDKMVDELDLSELMESYGAKGGSLFSPRDMFAILLYSYFEGITSCYKIHDNIQTNLRYIYLAGTLKVSRRTISDFRIRNLEFMRKIFSSTIKVANNVGLINSQKPFALDGSKFEANASMSKTASRTEWENHQEAILKHVDEYLAECKISDLEVLNEVDWDAKEKDEFDAIQARIAKLKLRKQTKPLLKGESKSKKTKKKKVVKPNDNEEAQCLLDFYEKIDDACEESTKSNFVNLTDPDCKLMKSDSVAKEAYNVQTISNNQVIVAVEVTQDEQDQHQLQPMVETLSETLDDLDIKEPITFLADAGYNAGYNLNFLKAKNNINAFISMYQRKTEKNKSLYDEDPVFEKENFNYDINKDEWICPSGKSLRHQKTQKENKIQIKHYSAGLIDCVYCKKRSSCIKTKADEKHGYRTLEDRFLADRIEMKKKMQLEESKEIYRRRCAEIEPVFGQIKANQKFKRFSLQKIKKVTGEMLLVAIAHNLNKIIRYNQLQKI